MLLVFRIVRNLATKNTSLLHEFFNKTDKHEILNYIKNLTTHHLNYENQPRSKGSNYYSTLNHLKTSRLIFLRFLETYRIKITFECFDITNSTHQNAFKIDETSAGRSMEKATVSRRRRRRTNAFRTIAVKTIKKKKQRRFTRKKKNMHNFDPYYRSVAHFPRLNDVNKIIFGASEPIENFARLDGTDADVKSFSDVLKDNSLLHSKGTNLKEFLKDVRYDVYTPYGKWLKDGWLDERAKTGVLFKVVSYNILSQHLLDMHESLYINHDPRYLNWEYRKSALISEIIDFDADILCLQEVEDSKVEFFDAELHKLGYRGIFKKRTNDKEDGCAIYYRFDKFDMKEYATVEYNQPYIRLLNRDNIGLIARLSCKETDKNIVIANTHLLFNPNRHDIKLAQLTMLLSEIDRVAFRSQEQNFISYHPVVLCGDLNLKPFTYAYNLIVDGYIENFTACFRDRRANRYPNNNQLMPTHLGITDGCQHYDVIKNRRSRRSEISDFKYVRLFNSDRKSLNASMTEPEWRREQINQEFFGKGMFYHALNLSSVYRQVHSEFGNASTFQDAWCNVDYIFYGPQKMVNGQREDDELKLVSYCRLPTHIEAQILKTIPNEVCGSDHLPLIATFHLPNSL